MRLNNLIKDVTFFYIKSGAKLCSVCRGAEESPSAMAVVESDFQNNILSVHKRRAKDGCPVAARGWLSPRSSHRSSHHRLSDAQEWAWQEGETVPAQNPDRLRHHRASKERHREPLTSRPFAPQSLELQPFPLEVLPSLIPVHTELPTIPRAANASVLFWGRTTAGFIPVCTNW